MTIEELKDKNKYDSYIILDKDLFDGLMHLKKFLELVFQGWTRAATATEEDNLRLKFPEFVKDYLAMIETMAEPLEHSDYE